MLEQLSFKKIQSGNVSTLKFYSLVAIILSVLVSIGLIVDNHYRNLSLSVEQSKLISNVKLDLVRNFYGVISDVLVLADKSGLYTNSTSSNKQLATRFESLARINKGYHQIRFIDMQGNEQVRLNYSDGITEILSEDKLQNKSDTTYFKQTLSMQKNGLYISRLDLNVENNQIEIPYTPVLRFSTPVFDTMDNKKGILIVNYFGEKMLELLTIHNRNNQSKLYLINYQGHYLYHKDPSKRWGFQLLGRPPFAKDYQEWQEIISTETGSITSSKGLFTFDIINKNDFGDNDWLNKYTPLSDINIFTQDKSWFIVSILDKNAISLISNERFQNVLMGFAILLLLLIPVSILWGRIHSQAQKLIDRDHLFAKIINQSDELIYLTDMNGRIKFINPAVEKLTGYTKSELIDKSPAIFKSGKQSADFYKHFWQQLKNGNSFEGTFINKHKNGSLFYENKKVMPLKNSNGDIIMFVSSGRDVTFRRKMYNREMDLYNSVAGGISHHIGNMLTVILGFSELISQHSEKEKNSPVSKYITQVIQASKKIEKLLDNVRMISSFNPKELSAIDLNPLLEDCISNWQKDLTTPINLTTLWDEPDLKVLGNEKSIQVALLAVLDNAIEAMVEHDCINISSSVEKIKDKVCVTCGEPIHSEFVVIRIKNTGSLIPLSIQKNIWDPFFSTKDSANLVGVTPGLGLSSVRTIIHKNNGHLLLDSNKTDGTVIRFLFPFI